jgi:hypothetical protein
MRKYAIAIAINGPEEYMRQHYGSDCYTDDIGHAILFDSNNDVPPTEGEEYIVEVEDDEEDGLYVIGRYAG